MACSKTIHGISSDCASSMGGIKKVLITEFSDSLYTVSGDTDGIPAAVTAVNSGATWHQYDFKKGAANFTSTLQVGDGGNFVSTEIQMTFSRMEAKKRLAIASLCLSEVAVAVQDQNGIWHAFGVTDGVTVSAATGSTGSAKTDANQYEITLTDDYETFAPVLSEAAVETILSNVETED